MPQYTTFPINYNTPPIKIANYFTGTNIGEKINAAINSFNGGVGQVWVFSEAAVNSIGISIELKSGITLKFHSGLYKMATATKIWMWDNSVLTGSGWDAIIQEPLVPWADRDNVSLVNGLRFIVTNGSRLLPAANNSSHPAYNLEVSNLQFKGQADNPYTQDVASVSLGNCHNGVIRNCWYNETSGYACGFGGTSGHAPGPDTDAQRTYIAYTQKEYGNNLRFENNLVEGVNTQNVAVFSAQNFSITGNTFVRASKTPIVISNAVYNGDGTATLTFATKGNYYNLGGSPRVFFLVGLKGPGWETINGYNPNAPITWTDPARLTMVIKVDATKTYGAYVANSGGFVPHLQLGAVIDLEPNSGYMSERMIGFNISNNIFDLTETVRFVAAIGCQAPTAMEFYSGTISNNIIRGPNSRLGNPFSGGVLTDGIYLGIGGNWGRSSAKGITISDNVIEDSASAGITLERAQGITISSNTLIDCGWNSGTGRAMLIADSNNSLIQNNIIRNPTKGTDGMEFVGPCSGNTVSGNIIGDATSGSSVGIYSRAGVMSNALTNNRFLNNTLMGKPGAGGIIEGAADGNNIYDGNLTYPNTNNAAGNQITGIKLRVGGGSKILTHKYTDGKVLIPLMSAT